MLGASNRWQTRLTKELVERYVAAGAWQNVTLTQAAIARVSEAPDRIAVVDGERRISFSELLEDAKRLASELASAGLKPGDIISFQLPNWWETVVINLAASLGGFIINPIVPIYRDAEVEFIVNDCRPSAIFIPQVFRSIDYVEMYKRVLAQAPDGWKPRVFVVRGEESQFGKFEQLLKVGAKWRDPEPSANAVKLLMYTSGTTGRPKGVLHSHNTLMCEMRAATDFWHITSGDVVLMPSPVTHIAGYIYALEYPIMAGIKAVLMERWDPQRAAQLVRSEQVTFTIGATPFLAEFADAVEASGEPVPSLRLFACGGAPVPPELVRRASEVLAGTLICRIYGSSEAPTVTLGISDAGEQERGADTDGKVVNNEVRIVNPESGEVLPVGLSGEITVRGPEIMLGYTHIADMSQAFDTDGFFRTGDLGSLSGDGFITVTGRKKDLIIRGGENLSPSEIEDAIYSHPAVAEVAVVAMPHHRLGETPCAFVVLHPGEELSANELRRHLEVIKLARQKFPESLYVIDAMPRTAAGKIMKHMLRQRLGAISGIRMR